jgi:putative transposase
MARLARIAVPGVPHHVTQRGNRRMAIFSQPLDYALYRDLIAERLQRHSVACWAYCLMPNHVHLVLTPPEGDAPAAAAALSRAVGEAHRRYTAFVNARARVTGHLFQGRFGCVAMDDRRLLDAVRYLAFNPVRARLCQNPEAWPWGSVRAHLAGRDDELVVVAPVLERAPRFRDLLELSPEELAAVDSFETESANGRPLGDGAFIAAIEKRLGRSLARGRPGRRKGEANRGVRN